MEPFELISGSNNAAFVFCDHASNAVPDWIGTLGLNSQDMNRHIAWDIGSETVGRTIARALDCGVLICRFSRLVIDVNRDPDAPTLIPHESDNTPIPRNQNLSDQDRTTRIERLYRPYHSALGDALDARPQALAISVHSFTPQLCGQPKRPTDIGLLMKDDDVTAHQFVAAMAQHRPAWQVDLNQPYSAYDLNFTVDYSVVPRGLRHLAIEVRQDHIADQDSATAMGLDLAHVIRTLID